MAVDPTSWAKRLALQQEAGLFRQPQGAEVGFADFCSNDFLGLGRQVLSLPQDLVAGASGSRHVSGLHAGLEALESWAATYWGAQRAVYFPTGFQANLGVLQALATRHDVVLMDARIHASLRDAARGTLAKTHFFRHNDVQDLQDWLQKAQMSRSLDGEIYVVTEGIFSMAGARAPLGEMVTLCRAFDATLVVDEAHSVGLHGVRGRGLVEELGLAEDIPIRIFPLGKAVGVQGGFVVGSAVLGAMLENFSRPLIYSTAPSPVLTWVVQNRLEAMAIADTERAKLKYVEDILISRMPDSIGGAVVPIYPDVETSWPLLLADAKKLGLWVKPIRYPTVPKGEECLRITLHSYQTDKELMLLQQWIQQHALKPLLVT